MKAHLGPCRALSLKTDKNLRGSLSLFGRKKEEKNAQKSRVTTAKSRRISGSARGHVDISCIRFDDTSLQLWSAARSFRIDSPAARLPARWAKLVSIFTRHTRTSLCALSLGGATRDIKFSPSALHPCFALLMARTSPANNER